MSTFSLYKVAIGSLLAASFSAAANVAVIVHPSNQSALDIESLKRIYLGKQKSFDNGEIAIPIDLQSETVREDFNKLVLNKSSSQIKAYWSKLMFTGKGIPPKELDNSQEVISAVSSNPGTIGYINASDVTDNVKVVLKL